MRSRISAERQLIEARTEAEAILTATAKALANPKAASLSEPERVKVEQTVAGAAGSRQGHGL